MKKKVIGYIIGVVLISGGIWYRQSSQQNTSPTYITAIPTRGMIIVSINGTGQVAAENKIDIKSKVAGDIVQLNIKPAQMVKKDDVLLEINKTDALKTIRDARQGVRDAQISLTSAKIALDKLTQAPIQSARMQYEHSVNSAQRALDALMEAPDDLKLHQAESAVRVAEQNATVSVDGITPLVVRNAYDDTVFKLVSASQSAVSGLAQADTILAVDNTSSNTSFVHLLSVLDQGTKLEAIAAYASAKSAVVKAHDATMKLALQNEPIANIDADKILVKDALDKTAIVLTHVTETLGATITSSSFSQSSLDSLKNSVQADAADIASKQQAFVMQDQSVMTAKNTFTNSGDSLIQATLALQKLKDGSNSKDIAAAKEKVDEATQNLKEFLAGPASTDIILAQNTVDGRASALATAESKLTDAINVLNEYSIRAPIDGVIATVPILRGDSVGISTVLFTILGSQQIAQITLNEVDIAKVKVGQKTTLGFDAIPGLTMTGSVQSIDTLGTVTQGVVSYTVKILFDIRDDRVRPGMSVHASIITDTKADALLVQNSAIKNSGNTQYVQVLDTSSTSANPIMGTLKRITVETGLTNDSQTEILNGITENTNVIIQTIQPKTSVAASASTQTNALRALTGGGGGGGNFNARSGGGGATGR